MQQQNAQVINIISSAMASARAASNEEMPVRLRSRPEFESVVERFDRVNENSLADAREASMVKVNNSSEVTNPSGVMFLDPDWASGGSGDFPLYIGHVLARGFAAKSTVRTFGLDNRELDRLVDYNRRFNHGYMGMDFSCRMERIYVKEGSRPELMNKLQADDWLFFSPDVLYKVDDRNIPIALLNLDFCGSANEQFMHTPLLNCCSEEELNKVLDTIRPYIAERLARQPMLCTIQSIDDEGKMEIVEDDLKEAKLANEFFYPWMGETSVREYFMDFFRSSANVLVLIGDPGTAKSTMIRTGVKTLGLRALTTSSQQLITNPNFLTSCGSRMAGSDDEAPFDLLVAEDAELLLRKRSDGNMAMSTLLDVTNGVGATHSFKLIVTLNSKDLTNVDPALLRPGRCFDVMEFGRLSAEESIMLRRSLHLPDLAVPVGWYTASEAINMDNTKTIKIDGNSVVAPRFSVKNRGQG